MSTHIFRGNGKRDGFVQPFGSFCYITFLFITLSRKNKISFGRMTVTVAYVHEHKTSNDNVSKDNTVMRALASHQCSPGLIPSLSLICRLSLLLVLFLVPRGFSAGSRFPNSNSFRNLRVNIP